MTPSLRSPHRFNPVVLPLTLLAGAILAAGCTHGTVLQGRIRGLADVLEQAERNGAYQCAPRQLAVGRSHLDFAQTELKQGDAVRAEQHLTVAEVNIQAAHRMSPPASCAPRGIVVSKPGDRDGDGVLDPQDTCPDQPEDLDGIEDGDGCPEDQDTDGDGIMDSEDLCILTAEDMDGYLDADGCPEIDNDADGITDDLDRCVDEPEDMDGFEDSDGCPESDNDGDHIEDTQDECPLQAGPESEKGCPKVYENVEVTGTAIRITQKVFFQSGKARIRPVSFPLLNTVAVVLGDYPEVTVEIQGHTDSRGNDRYNLRLSQQRAEAVREYLIQQGVDPVRMTAQGFGETSPIETNQTTSGRAANRRVEFIRTDEAAKQAGGASLNPSDLDTTGSTTATVGQ